MKTWVILAIIAVAVVQGTVDQWNLLHFSKNEDQLRDCLENRTDLPKVLPDDIIFPYWERDVIGALSQLTYSQSMGVVRLDKLAKVASQIIRKAAPGLYKDQLKQIEGSIKNALVNCSDPVHEASGRIPNCYVLPRFIQEPPELAELFDFLFIAPGYYLNTSNHTEKVFLLIESGLRRLGNSSELEKELLRMWQRRAKLYFDGKTLYEYIGNVYGSGHPRPCTHQYPGIFNERMYVNFSSRDYFHPNSYQRKIVDFFPNTPVFTGSRVYYEKERFITMRALFVRLELLEQGREVSSVVLPDDLDNILHGSVDDFRQYFDNRQRLELSHGFANSSARFSSLVKSLRPGERIDGLDLLVMFWYRLRSNVTTTNKSTTFNYKESK